MPTIGLDCQIIIDGTGYWIDPASYHMARPRVRSSTYNHQAASNHLGVGERYVDMGPGKREWTLIVIAWQAIDDYTGARVASTGQQFRDALWTSYEKVATVLSFTDPQGSVWNVHFDHLEEIIDDIRAQPDGELQYTMHVSLVEA